MNELQLGKFRWIEVALRIGAFGVLLLPLSACQLPPGKKTTVSDKNDWNVVRARVKLQLAEKQMAGAAYADAVRTFNEAIALDPAGAAAYAGLAEAHLELGNLASAQEALDAARRRACSSPALFYMQGLVDEQQDRNESALENYAAARVRHPKNVDYVVAEAETLVELNRAGEALELLRASRDGVDDVSTVELVMARVSALLGNSEQAVRHYRAALAGRSDHPAAREELALLLAKLNRCDEALPLLTRTLERQTPSAGPVVRAAAQCRLETGDAGGAAAVLNPYVRENPADAAAQLLRAQIALALEDGMTAAVALDAAARHGGSAQEIEILRVVLDLRRGDLDRAESRLVSLHDRAAGDPEVLCLMGELHLARQRPAEARRCFEQVLAANPKNSWAAQRLRESG